MLYVPQKRFRTAQPFMSAPVNWANPITEGLLFVNGALAWTLQAFQARFPSRIGPAIREGTYKLITPDTRIPADRKRPTEGTMFVLPYWDHQTYGYPLLRYFNYWSSGTQNSIGICWGPAWNGSIGFKHNVNNVDTLNYVGIAGPRGIANGKSFAMSGGPAGIRCYSGSEVVITNPVTTWVSSFATDTGVALGLLGENLGAGAYTDQPVSIALVFDRQLSDLEVASLSVNPWQIFQ